MCLIFVAYKCSTRHRFVIGANRDEFRNRPTAKLGFRNPEKTIIGGQDLKAGGMWLGVSRDGSFAAVTNYRDGVPATAQQPSRGEIVYSFLFSKKSALQAMEDLAKVAPDYAGFNVFFGDGEQLVYFSNRENCIRILPPGYYGLSNHLLDTPWPKVERGKRLLQPHMCCEERIDTRAVTSLLQDTVVPPDEKLPDTGVGLEWERRLGSIFISGKDYGTVSSAVVEMEENGGVIFSETSYIQGADAGICQSHRQLVLHQRDESWC